MQTAHAHSSHRQFPYSCSVQPLYNSFPLSPKWCRDGKKANRKPLRGTRNTTKAAHHSKISITKGFSKGLGSKNDPTHLHRHLDLVLCVTRVKKGSKLLPSILHERVLRAEKLHSSVCVTGKGFGSPLHSLLIGTHTSGRGQQAWRQEE